MKRHIGALLSVLFLPLVAIGAGAEPAAAAAPHYVAQPAAQAASDTLVVRGLVWKCGPAGCTAGKSNSRPATDCAALARQVGSLIRFVAGGRELPAEALEKCNARAR
ncbi:MAG TPA: hypothetical protein VEZ70_10440 [Allosphingosinicella sp.]|nr:hypothetical protein [Allosphingosinicella sp.]